MLVVIKCRIFSYIYQKSFRKINKKIKTKMREEKRYQIAVSLIPGVGDVIGKKLIAYCGSAEGVFDEGVKALNKIPGIGSKLAKIIKESDTLQRADEELAFMEKQGVKMVFYSDKDYPFRLKQCDDGPLILYYKGENNFNADKIISIVGTRTASTEGKLFCDNIVNQLAKFNTIIVSGLAYGIDICAHKAALKNGLPTWAVLAHGHDRIYPQPHRNIANEILGKGALISDYISKTEAERQNFPSRNRIIAGLSDATIVIESATKGGSLITANIANSYNREVFAMPGKPKDEKSAGCNALIKTQRAILLEGIDDIIRELNWDVPNKQKEVHKQLLIELSDEEKQIINFFPERGLHIDSIVSLIDWPSSKVAQMLLQLEFKGVIIVLPGKMYKRV
jgi:DNA processing protein